MQLQSAHIAVTPLAGSPIRIVKALNKHSEVRARLLVLNPDMYGPRVYENDLVWNEDRDECLDALESADILHFHHWIDLSNNHFQFDFKRLVNSGKKIIWQFHSTPFAIGKGDSQVIGKITSDRHPKLVVAQHQERYFPLARVVPNIIPHDDEDYLPQSNEASPVIFFAPSVVKSAWYTDDPRLRWDTKGYPETLRMLQRVKNGFQNVTLNIKTDIAHRQCLQERRQSHLSIDDLVTGSYHLSSLEGLAQGVPTFAYLDARTQSVLYDLTGATHLPWLNCNLESAERVITELLHDDDLRLAMGRHSREWIERNWSEQMMIRHYVKAYEDLMEHPDLFSAPRFDLEDKKTYWFVQLQHDLVWRTNSEKSRSWLKRLQRVW